MLPTIQIGPLALQTGPLVLLLSFMAALEVSHRSATRLGLDGDSVYNMGYVAAVAALLGARLGYVMENWDVFAGDPAAMLALTSDGLSLVPALAAGVLVAYAYAQRKGLDNLRLLDGLAPGLVVLAAGMALAGLASGGSYGVVTAAPWALRMWGEPRHPVQIYHLLAALIVGVLIVKAARPFDGARFGLFVLLYAASRFVLEAFHGDSALVNGFRTVQAISLATMLAALLVLRWLARRNLAPMEPRSSSGALQPGQEP